MSFLSWQYAFFLPLVVVLYWALGLRGRMVLLLLASYVFYGMWDIRFLALLMGSTCVDYFCGRAIVGDRAAAWRVVGAALLPLAWLWACRLIPHGAGEVRTAMFEFGAIFAALFPLGYLLLWRFPERHRRNGFLLLSISSNLAVLGIFKYFLFFATSLMALLQKIGWECGWVLPHVVLPVAVSFYTFQSIAYAVDVYQGKAKPAQDLLTFGAYLAFFPQLVAGPIERPAHLLTQFQHVAKWDWNHLHAGLRLLLIGAFKKAFVADNCAILASYVFAPDARLNAPWAILGVLAFTFQIYGDFSGYTDMARGSARLLGIELSQNFRLPYASCGPSDFWQRWHITLSRWFRDYVYIPLGGNRYGPILTLRNLWVTMLLAGLWHGANWTFVLWGGYHAALLTLYRLVPWLGRLETNTEQRGFAHYGSVVLMFCLTSVGWAIFRAPGLAGLGAWFAALGNFNATLPWLKPACWLAVHAVPLLLLQWATLNHQDESDLDHLSWPVRGVVFLLMFVLFASALSGEQEFIYFQF